MAAEDLTVLRAIEGVPRDYAWGSPTLIPELLGLPACGEPVAELWFDEGLPFLLKLLAADRALSIQVHPDPQQAHAGFRDEEARGVAQQHPARNYRDPNHKPELLCALTEFDALCGFRPVAQTLRLLDALGVAELIGVRHALEGADGLRAAFTLLLDTPPAERPALIAAVVEGCRRIAGDDEWALAAQASLNAARDYPGDIGAVLALLLNAVRLRPGEAIFLAAGNVHAYLRGLGVEIMANSDNVLRCGLTPKHVDVAEVLRVADFSELIDPRCPAEPVDHETRVFQTPIADFQLSITTVDGVAPIKLHELSPQVLLCTEGTVAVTAEGETLELSRGGAAYVGAGDIAGLAGTGTVFRATTQNSPDGG